MQLPGAVRQDLRDAIDRAWLHLARPGTWFTGKQRLQIAAEARKARECELCRRRLKSISPYAVDGTHDSVSDLPEVVIEATHRLSTDAARVTEKWLHACYAKGLTDAEYVEIVGIVATIYGLDTFDHAFRSVRQDLPEPVAGEPLRHRPKNAKKTISWVPTLSPEDLTDAEPDIFAMYGVSYVRRGLSLVPHSMMGFMDLDCALYLSLKQVGDFSASPRALSHAQIELVAARASARNGCYYCATFHAELLRKSGDHEGSAFNLHSVVDTAEDSGVPAGGALLDFTDAALSDDIAALDAARLAVTDALGFDAMVDAAAAIASFNAVVKMTDGTGLAIEPVRRAAAETTSQRIDMSFVDRSA